MACDRCNCDFSFFKTSKKWKKKPGDIIILQKSTINDSHKIYGSWYMKCNRHFFLAFCAISCPFTSITAQKMKIWRKWKRTLEILSFNTSVPKIMIICFTVPEIWRDKCNCYFSFWTIFWPFYHPNSPKNENFKKKKKNHGDIII